MPEDSNQLELIDKKLGELNLLLRYSIVVQLYLMGATQNQIAENLHMGKQTVNKMVKGLKQGKKKAEKQGAE